MLAVSKTTVSDAVARAGEEVRKGGVMLAAAVGLAVTGLLIAVAALAVAMLRTRAA